MRSLILLYICIAFVNSNAYSKCKDKPVRVGVIDTGFGYDGRGNEARLCKSGHKNFSSEMDFTLPGTTSIPVPMDHHGHGTNVVGIIESFLRSAHINYCIVILKYHAEHPYYHESADATVQAFDYATKNKIDYLNYSSGGTSPYKEEERAVKAYLDQGGKLIASAGNDGNNLDSSYGYYPAKYDNRIIVVGSTDYNGVKLRSSNYGSIVKRWEVGLQVSGYGIVMSGTSQAAAVATGKIVSQNKNKCDIGK